MANLVAADYAVIIITMIISSGIGVYYWLSGGKQKSMEEYFMADRSMQMLPVAIGLTVSYISAVSLLGVSSENYVYGTQYAVINISYGLATPFVVYLYMPVFFKIGKASAFEYLHKRFGKAARMAGSFAFTLQLLLYSGVVLYAPALALEATTGISTTASVIGIGLVCTFYSTIGGIKAVLITDVFQSLLMLIAIILVIITAAMNVGGLDKIWEIARQGSRIEFDSISMDPTVRHTWWSLTFGGFFTYLSLYGTNQVQVQRMLTIKNVKHAQSAIWISWPLSSLMSLGLCFTGLAIYTRYRNCDPLESGRIGSYDQLMPLYVMDMLSAYPGVPGLFIAGIFSAGLSTISATVNSLAAVILEDFIKPICRLWNKEITATGSIIISKILAVIVGISCIGLAFMGHFLGGLLQAALTIFGVVGGPVFGMFTLGMFTRLGNQRGAIVGLLTSLVFSLWIGFGQPKPPIPNKVDITSNCSNATHYDYEESSNLHFEYQQSNNDSYFYLYRISYMWYCPLGSVLSFGVGWIFSWISNLILNEEPQDIDPDLFTPILASKLHKKRLKNSNEYHSTVILDTIS
ncbi:putative sodium-dependent multivitamin transporter isoform X1 [Apis laboriosa]|uniref:putative sodium-dependent multivitamin transporter isoform X1 n=1 Tax=Apis laboriosa TaxID=183418 RepID=UPI001CC7591A|nr:putative sodium-dependent multivitamin transporter isoform X1 [Apis laboriosa]XP_043800723.1 putative sodium-dependent multivitamin transporter isoform X1 [Apis laboriosa]XP_043800724.1 putative sodium-dependent multivitamin transporter isoform X1 [Apis laboriosa]XP_043800725.1 putative sodium-dependent multivitamin transporter isoform X1 [Apis laboriosa]XP_043800726.1 putative sodium-dependent multivitamin transporter isoform X1 [Apis laboriosa]XP_043800727.1 putative sodium-dependent mult